MLAQFRLASTAVFVTFQPVKASTSKAYEMFLRLLWKTHRV